jgi:signal transduction histidine kinase
MAREWIPNFKWRILSIPIFFKILGIGFLTAVLFGAVTLVQMRSSASKTLYQLLEQRAISMSRSLADTIERPVSIGDLFSVNGHLDQARKTFPEIRYIIIRDQNKQIIASTFKKGIPADLLKMEVPDCLPNCSVQIYGSTEGLILDVFSPLSLSPIGTVEVGVLDQMVTKELAALRNKVIWGLMLCAVIGVCLALGLTDILTRPIHHLVQATNEIRKGEFETRAKVFSNDEIGRLAVAFNHMAEALMKYREEVQIKERMRLSLIERIVQVQEDERKTISRELHDHFGQSLLALMLKVESGCKFSTGKCEFIHCPGSLCCDIKDTINQIIGDAHRLAWGMHPSILDDYGLDSALARHIQELSKTAGVEIDYQFTSPDGMKRLPARIEVTLFRIAQEALTNVVRHSGATHASVIILRQINEITMLIEDNGRGFEYSAKDRSDQCLGLMGMEERANLLGGGFVVESAPGEGTTIRVKIPLNEE